MSFFVTRPGALTERVSVGHVLRYRHSEAVEARSRRIEAGEVDPDTGKPLEPLPPYDGDPQLDDVRVRVRSIAGSVLRDTAGRITLLANRAEPDTDAAVESLNEQTRLARELVAAAVVEVSGLSGVEGEAKTLEAAADRLSEDHLDLLEQNGLLWVLFDVARGYQYLQGKARRDFGSAPPLTSPTSSSTAPDVPPQTESGRGATGGEIPGSSVTNIRPTAAPDAGPSNTPGSPKPSDSSTTPEAA